MRLLITKGALALLGLALVGLILGPGTSGIVQARPLLSITGTPVEPPPSTAVPLPATAVPPANTAEATAVPQQPDKTSAPESRKHDQEGVPDVVLVETIDQASATPGDLLGFSMHITNKGTKTARNVVVSNTMAEYLDLHDHATTKGSIHVTGRTLTASIDTISPGEYVVVRMRAYLQATTLSQGTNGGDAADSNGDSDLTNNSSGGVFAIYQLQPSPTTPPEATPETTSAPPASAPTGVMPTAMPMQPTKAAVVAPRPAKLPITGDGENTTGGIALLALLSVGVIALGIFLRRRTTA